MRTQEAYAPRLLAPETKLRRLGLAMGLFPGLRVMRGLCLPKLSAFDTAAEDFKIDAATSRIGYATDLKFILADRGNVGTMNRRARVERRGFPVEVRGVDRDWFV